MPCPNVSSKDYPNTVFGVPYADRHGAWRLLVPENELAFPSGRQIAAHLVK